MFRVVRDFIAYLVTLPRGFLAFNRLEIVGEDHLAARLVVAGKTSARINPAMAPLRVLVSLEPVGLPETVVFQFVRHARFGDAAGEAGFDDRDRVGLVHQFALSSPRSAFRLYAFLIHT